MRSIGTLSIVGAGIKTPAHLTFEATYYIKNASKVFYLLNGSSAIDWLKSLHSNSEDLAPFYKSHLDRIKVYKQMASHVVKAVLGGETVCLVFYGHPNVYVYPTRELLLQAQEHQFGIKLCPGISADACLFADLGIDPARTGCQSYDATDFLIRPRQFDTTAGLVLWQIGVIGNLSTQSSDVYLGIGILQEVLLRYYPKNHIIYVYESALHPDYPSIVQPVSLDQFDKARVTTFSTLYVPALSLQEIDQEMLARLGIAKHLLDQGS